VAAGALFLAAADPLSAAPGGGGTSKQDKPSPALPTATPKPVDKAAAQKENAQAEYDKGYEEVEKAKAEFEEAAKIEAEGGEDAAKKAAKLRASGAKRYQKAIEKFQKTVELDATDHEAWNMLGYSYRKTGQIGNAYKAYESCLALSPDYEPAHEYLGEAHLAAGNIEKAKEELTWLQGKKSKHAATLEAAIQAHVEGKAGSAPAGSGW
jgi:tetratricopeptide (TPR) repeat protein